jgi:hypothetical protein
MNLPYQYGEVDYDGYPPTGITSEITPNNNIFHIILNKILETNNNIDKDSLCRMYVNCFAPLEHPYFHTDSDEYGITFLFYLNTIWNIDDCGETQFLINNQIIGIPPIPNRMIAFDSELLHKATSFRNRHRFTIAAKFDQNFDIMME